MYYLVKTKEQNYRIDTKEQANAIECALNSMSPNGKLPMPNGSIVKKIDVITISQSGNPFTYISIVSEPKYYICDMCYQNHQKTLRNQFLNDYEGLEKECR